jgi:hypothetical protein
MMAVMREVLVATLLVAAACGDPSVKVTVLEADGSAGVFLAYQDGDGPWEAVASDDEKYSFEVSSGRYGVAVWCAASRYRHVAFDYLTTSEVTSFTAPAGCPVANVTLNGLVRNMPNNAQVSWSFAAVTADGGGSYALMGPAGTHDLVATGYQLAGAGRTIDALVILRDREVGGNMRIDLDLGDDPIELDTHDLTLAGELADDFTSVSTAFFSAGRTGANLSSASGDDLTFQVLPEDALIDGDRQSVIVQATGPAVAGQPQRSRSHVVHTEGGGDLSVELLAATDAPDVSDGPTFTWSPFDGAEAYHLAVTQTDTSGAEHDFDGFWSPGYLDDEVVLALPDLTDVEGWDPRVDLVGSTTMFWSISARTSNVSLADAISEPEAGTELSTTGWFGSFVP